MIELLKDVLAKKPRETDGFESVIIVDGVPQVGPDRLEKLKNVIKKIFSAVGTIVSEYLALDAAGHTKGWALDLHVISYYRSYMILIQLLYFHRSYAFIEYLNESFAREAVERFNNHKLDKQHTFLVNLFTDYDK